MDLEAAAKRLAKLSDETLRPFATRNFGREQYPEAFSVVLAGETGMDRPLRILKKLRPELDLGVVAFIGTNKSLADDAIEGTEIIVGPGRDQFDILRLAQSDACNYDLETEDLIRKLQEYENQVGIDILQADTDFILLELQSLPEDLSAFCQDVYEFCPDIVDQGVGSVEALEEAIVDSDLMLGLWWD